MQDDLMGTGHGGHQQDKVFLSDRGGGELFQEELATKGLF